MKSLPLFSLLSLSATCAFGAINPPASKGVIVIDAGSSGTRIHVYQKQTDSIKDVYTLKLNQPLAGFVDCKNADPTTGVDDAGVQKLISKLMNQAKGQYSNSYPVYVYATAGMRLIRQGAQQQVMNDVTTSLKQQGLLGPIDARVIRGSEEAKFDWISLNSTYLTSTNPKGASQGALDLGGASTQIAFQVPSDTQNNNVVHITINNKNYSLYAKSYLGLGEDQAIATVGNDFPSSRATCYPTNTFSQTTAPNPDPNQPGFNIVKCQGDIQNYLLARVQVNGDIKNLIHNAHFIAFSGYAYTDDFFSKANLSNLPETVSNFCSNTTWKSFSKTYLKSAGSRAYLQKYCFTGTYVATLLSDAYGLSSDQVSFAAGADWTKGVALLALDQ